MNTTISRHIKNLFSEGELNRNSVVAKYATTVDVNMFVVNAILHRHSLKMLA